MRMIAFDRFYIWERPVRLYHWVSAASVVVLVATGLLMGRPPALLSSAEPWSIYWFGLVRFLHLVAGFAFTFVFVLRVYWSFAGNQFASWRNFLPITPQLFIRQFREVRQVVKVDVLEIQVEPIEIAGHNALAAWSYTAVFAATVFEIATGFALHAPMSASFLPQLFGGVTALLGGDAMVRLWHHAATWFFILFTAVHVYLCVYHDVVEGRGELSSMVSGSKFIKRGARALRPAR